MVLTYPSGGPEVRRFMEALSAMWQMNLGAKVQIYNVEWKVFLQARQLKQPVVLLGCLERRLPRSVHVHAALPDRYSDMNDGGYHNPQFDALVDQASSIERRAPSASSCFIRPKRILNEDAPLLPVYFYESAHLIKPYVKGWQSNVMDRNLSRYMYILAHQES